jgi:hypothetical protein
MDYSVKHKIGNLLEGDYFSLFASKGMAELHAENTKPGFSDKSICKSCSRAQRYELVGQEKKFWEVVGPPPLPRLQRWLKNPGIVTAKIGYVVGWHLRAMFRRSRVATDQR